MTLYSEGEGGDASEVIGDLICDTLEGGNIADSHNSIQSLECIAEENVGILPTGVETEEGTPVINPASGRYATPVSIMAAIAALTVFVGVVYAYRRNRTREEADDVRGGTNNDEEAISAEDREIVEHTLQDVDLSVISPVVENFKVRERQNI